MWRVMVPHQANIRIINAAAERLGIAPEKVMINIDRYGNTTAGTIPLATRDAMAQGRLKKGDLVLFAAVGRAGPWGPACGAGRIETGPSGVLLQIQSQTIEIFPSAFESSHLGGFAPLCEGLAPRLSR